MTDVAADPNERIADLAERFRSSGAIGRAEVVGRLFDFLLEQTLAGRSPKETEVAHEVFGRTPAYDGSQDASVRVHIHRLRKKLDELHAGTSGERLTIPRGEYRLALVAGGKAREDYAPPARSSEAETLPIVEPSGRTVGAWIRTLLIALGVGIVAGLGIASASGLGRDRGANALSSTDFWQPLAVSKASTFVITGDYYLFGEAADTFTVTRLIRENSINSQRDLDDYLMARPEYIGRFVDLGLHYSPVSAGYAMSDLLPVVNDLTKSAGVRRPYVVTMSRFAPEALKRSNIVYIGFLNALGMLRDPLFEASGFALGRSYDDLVDRASGKHYVADGPRPASSRSPGRNFAYLASLPGPTGNHIRIIAGTVDAAVMQAAEIAIDKAQLEEIARQVGGAAAFEALYEVRTLGTLNLGSKLILARPLTLDRAWSPRAASPLFHERPSPPKTPADP
jgi:hypothetical protein